MSANELIPLVALYRLLKRPHINGFVFEANVLLSKEYIDLLEDFYRSKDRNGSQVEVEFGSVTINDLEMFSEKRSEIIDSKANIYVRLRRNAKKRFYLSSKEFYKPVFSNTSSRELDSYYLVEEDYFHGIDDISNRPQSMAVFDEVLFFIDKVKSISDSCDTRNQVSKATLFLPDTDDKERVRPFDIFLEIGEPLLDLSPESFSLLKELDVNDFEKNMLLKTAIIEILSECKNENHILFFFKNWSKVEKAFLNNYELYLRGISFSKLRQEVHERHLKYYDDVNSSLIDVSLKLALLPTTFSLWLFFVRSDFSVYKSFGFFIALSIMAILFSNVLLSLKNKLDFLKGSLNKQVDLFKSKYRDSKKDFENNSDIEQDIGNISTDVSEKITKAIRWIYFGYVVLWLPVVIVLAASLYFLLCPRMNGMLSACRLLLVS